MFEAAYINAILIFRRRERKTGALSSGGKQAEKEAFRGKDHRRNRAGGVLRFLRIRSHREISEKKRVLSTIFRF